MLRVFKTEKWPSRLHLSIKLLLLFTNLRNVFILVHHFLLEIWNETSSAYVNVSKDGMFEALEMGLP